MSKWFKNVSNVEELRKQYKELLKKYHPDNDGGSVEITQKINAEYDAVFARMSRENKADGESTTYDNEAEDRAFREVLEKISTLNVTAEIVGSWIWISGGYECRELLKSIGFKFAPKKKCWCWHFGDYHRRSKREISLDEIRQKYGSQKVNSKSKQFVLN